MSTYFPLHVHTHDSFLDGLSKPSQVAKRCDELGLPGCAITDHGRISGAVSFSSALSRDRFHVVKDGKDVKRNFAGEEFANHYVKEHCENGEVVESPGLKPILGCELYVTSYDPRDKSTKRRDNNHLVVLAKNKQGWKDLIQITSKAFDPALFYYNPRIDLPTIKSLVSGGNLIAFSGHLGSHLASAFFETPGDAYSANSYEEAKELVHPDWVERVTAEIRSLQDVFGEENFFVEIQLIDQENSPASQVVAKGLRWLAKKLGLKCIGTPDAHYAYPEDAYDHRVLLCNNLNTTLREVERKSVSGEDVALGTFFRSDRYHIPSYETMAAIHTPEELSNTLLVASMCEEYKITGPPMLPKFPTPDNKTSAEYLRELCREGWTQRLDLIKKVIAHPNFEYTQKDYVDRLEKEMTVLDEAGLADYFLIVWDIIAWAVRDGQLTGAGRGSAAGSLILYLLGVTHIDPIEFDLLFERFYNAGRNTAEHVSLPDVDMDFEKHGRERVLVYMKQRYGEDHVAQMITFQTMQGRGAIKDVIRAHGIMSYEDANKITENLPEKADIEDQLEIMREHNKNEGGDGDISIIQWTLENSPDDLREWAYLDDDGNIQGPLAKIFEQAIRLEGTKKGTSKHAAGVVISQEPLAEVCPMVYDKTTGALIAGMEMNDLEAMGHVKFDVLGISCLDKIKGCLNLIRTGNFYGHING
jgi:DNA polymerase-3 subunit alpha